MSWVPNFAEQKIWAFMIGGGIGNYPGIMIAARLKHRKHIVNRWPNKQFKKKMRKSFSDNFSNNFV